MEADRNPTGHSEKAMFALTVHVRR